MLAEHAKQGTLNLVTTDYVLAEAERNIREKLGNDALLAHYANIKSTRLAIHVEDELTSRLDTILAQVIHEKDIPIVIGAMISGADFLIRLDRKHLLNNNKKLLALGFHFQTITPGDFLQKYFVRK